MLIIKLKTDKLDSIRSLHFSNQRHHRKVKRESTNWEKTFTVHISEKALEINYKNAENQTETLHKIFE